MIITAKAHARAGLVGNPSDGYFGKTISFIIRNFSATVRLWESPHFEIVPTHGDLAHFEDVRSFLRDQKLHGYYGGLRLVKASVKKFHEYAQRIGADLHDRNFTISYETDIPRLVGLSGSSAIVTATLRALIQFYQVEVPTHLLPSMILSVEKEELGINAGLQDRVIQTYEGIVYMDFDSKLLDVRGYGEYIPLKPEKTPPLYVAYDPERAEVSDIPHRNLRELFNRGEPSVVSAMQEYRRLTDQGRDALMAGDWDQLGKVMNANFDLRRTIMNIVPENLRMVEVARATGASAKFCGSGGAICGLYRDGRHYQQLSDALAHIRCSVIRPMVFE
ncbi:MAG: GHMP kinase [Phycisphaerales bacterium]|jgi:glucuronokinase|nr:GHMP kinase [Phycisphaerales bacterium]